MSARRVVVLARAGSARERTEQAVRATGAELVASLDPVEATEEDVRARGAEALLVVLDAVTEAALERFDPLLTDPGLLVVFDEAELAGRREGWEAARWVRHLAAKLQGHDDVLPPPPAQKAGPDFIDEMQALAAQVAALPPVPQAARAVRKTGAVVILAGIGGPDAARQLLAGLPGDFPRPLVLRQALDGGQYDKLARQMQRATPLQVELAQSQQHLQAGHVYVLPDGLDVVADADGPVFAAVEGAPTFAGLPAGDSALLLLSGAGLETVDLALAMRLGGALVYGQAPETCFDPSASHALIARGGDSRSLAEMARELVQCWPA